MREELQQLKKYIYEDGWISANEVAVLRRLFTDGADRDEADLLMDLNTILSDMVPYPQEFSDLYIKALTAYVIGKDGLIAPDTWEWLKTNILKDNRVDRLERRLLDAIAARAQRLPGDFSAYRR
ncbi:MAG: hypothetical protein AB7G39_12000 [Alphaproteobacteria bacterium]